MVKTFLERFHTAVGLLLFAFYDGKKQNAMRKSRKYTGTEDFNAAGSIHDKKQLVVISLVQKVSLK